MSDEANRAPARQLSTGFRAIHDLESLLKSLIAVLDSFDRLLSDPAAGSPTHDPMALLATCGRIARQLESAVGAAGLVGFGECGDVLDIYRHMIVDVAQRDGAAEDTVVAIVRRGYEKDGRVIRPAEVVIAAQPEEPEA